MKNLIFGLWKLDVKIGCYYIYENQLIWKLGEFEENKYLITWLVFSAQKFKKLYIYIYI
jgi:hypothetical protein